MDGVTETYQLLHAQIRQMKVPASELIIAGGSTLIGAM